jgi:CBS domain-containing protein
VNIKDCMKSNVFFILSTASISDAASTFVEHHVGLLPVVDDQGRPIGMLRLSGLLSLELPDFVNLIDNVKFVHDFGAVETTRPTHKSLTRPASTLMEPVITVTEDSGLLRAYSLMLQHNLMDMPVVDSKGGLVGIVSRVDIGTAILSLWPAGKR